MMSTLVYKVYIEFSHFPDVFAMATGVEGI